MRYELKNGVLVNMNGKLLWSGHTVRMDVEKNNYECFKQEGGKGRPKMRWKEKLWVRGV